MPFIEYMSHQTLRTWILISKELRFKGRKKKTDLKSQRQKKGLAYHYSI